MTGADLQDLADYISIMLNPVILYSLPVLFKNWYYHNNDNDDSNDSWVKNCVEIKSILTYLFPISSFFFIQLLLSLDLSVFTFYLLYTFFSYQGIDNKSKMCLNQISTLNFFFHRNHSLTIIVTHSPTFSYSISVFLFTSRGTQRAVNAGEVLTLRTHQNREWFCG